MTRADINPVRSFNPKRAVNFRPGPNPGTLKAIYGDSYKERYFLSFLVQIYIKIILIFYPVKKSKNKAQVKKNKALAMKARVKKQKIKALTMKQELNSQQRP